MDIQTSMNVPRQVWCPLGSLAAVPRNYVEAIMLYIYFPNLASLELTTFLIFLLMRSLQLVPPAPFVFGSPSRPLQNPQTEHPETHVPEANTSNPNFAHATLALAEFSRAIVAKARFAEACFPNAHFAKAKCAKTKMATDKFANVKSTSLAESSKMTFSKKKQKSGGLFLFLFGGLANLRSGQTKRKEVN